jgi:hypothetical protein
MDRISKYMTTGVPRECRNNAIAGYSKLAALLIKDADRKKASDVIAQSLNDWHLRTREAAVEGLATVADPSALPNLQRMASNDPVAEVRDRAHKASDRVTAQIAAGKATTDQSATIEELKRRVQTLETEADQARQDAAAKSKKE